jgi:hypothetical protein
VILTLSFSGKAFASVTEEQIHVFSKLGFDSQFRWLHADEQHFGYYNTWNNFTDSMPEAERQKAKDNHLYVPGCDATAVGAIMYYLLKYKYPELSTSVFLPNPDKKYTFRLDYLHKGNNAGIKSYTQVTRKRILSDIISPDNDGHYRYNWSAMHENLIGGINGNFQVIRDHIAPLLFDVGIAMSGHYYIRESDGSAYETLFRKNNPKDTVVNEFGFEHAASFSLFTAVEPFFDFLMQRWERNLRKIIETNLDMGHPVFVSSAMTESELTGHTYLIQGYGMLKHLYLANHKDTRNSFYTPWNKYYYLINGLGDEHLTANWDKIFSLTEGRIPWPIKIFFNVFPKIPDKIKECGRTPEILSGRVIPQFLTQEGDAFSQDAEIYVQPKVITLFLDDLIAVNVDILLDQVKVDNKTGVYAVAVPNDSKIELQVVDLAGNAND